jgi:hypothetical protein
MAGTPRCGARGAKGQSAIRTSQRGIHPRPVSSKKARNPAISRLIPGIQKNFFERYKCHISPSRAIQLVTFAHQRKNSLSCRRLIAHHEPDGHFI